MPNVSDGASHLATKRMSDEDGVLDIGVVEHPYQIFRHVNHAERIVPWAVAVVAQIRQVDVAAGRQPLGDGLEVGAGAEEAVDEHERRLWRVRRPRQMTVVQLQRRAARVAAPPQDR